MRDESGSNHGWRGAITAGVLASLCVAGCDTNTGTGGAVELSWKLRPNSSDLNDKFVDCDPGGDDPDRGPVTWMRLAWEVTDENGVTTKGHDRWPCNDNHGVTRFALEPGTASLTLTPLCGLDPPLAAAPGTYIAPAPVIRTVARGDTISLGAVELVIAVAPCAAGLPACICTEPAP
ncbi:MAG TPA: hypothetical protein VFP84_02260 [Kofleriaceae bacterium]|nr:hypothetical protein [Kofleriaceae bacterium]